MLNSTLVINGVTNVNKNIWDVHFDNIQVLDGSVAATVDPAITNSTTISNFQVLLNKPGDYYYFTVDVVNNGTLDAMIDNFIMVPDLTVEQAKYLNYKIDYENGEQIKTNQLIRTNESLRIKVVVEYKKDLSSTDLPTTLDLITLGFTINYVQAEDDAQEVKYNGKLINILSGDLDTVGSEICIKNECFYVISSTNDSVRLLSKYNLLIGNIVTGFDDIGPISTPVLNPTGLQDSTARAGLFENENDVDYPWIGTIAFSNIEYWDSTLPQHHIYNEQSILFEYVENYKDYFESLYLPVEEARIIYLDELYDLGCDSHWDCPNSPDFLFTSSYWVDGYTIYHNGICVYHDYIYKGIGNRPYNSIASVGLRPVIVLSKTIFNR